MPIVQIHLMKGRNIDTKRLLVSKVTNAICESLELAPEKVRIILSEIEPENYGKEGKLRSDKQNK